jgi:hypothetical protein
MRAITGLSIKPNLVCWMAARSLWLVLVAIIFPAFALVIPIQIAIAAAAFVAGTRFAETMRKSAARTAT